MHRHRQDAVKPVNTDESTVSERTDIDQRHGNSQEGEIQNRNPWTDAPRSVKSEPTHANKMLSHDIILARIKQNWTITKMADMIAPKTWLKGVGENVTWDDATLRAFYRLSQVSEARSDDVKEMLRKRWDDRSHNRKGFKKAVGDDWSKKQGNLRQDIEWLTKKYEAEVNMDEKVGAEVREEDQSDEENTTATREQNESATMRETRSRTKRIRTDATITSRQRMQDVTKNRIEEPGNAYPTLQPIQEHQRMNTNDQGDYTSFVDAQQPPQSQLRDTEEPLGPSFTHPSVRRSTSPTSGSVAFARHELDAASRALRLAETEVEAAKDRRDMATLDHNVPLYRVAQAEAAVTEAQQQVEQARVKLGQSWGRYAMLGLVQSEDNN
jgi:hypothetical protein